jgi:hypothetical protein
MLEQTLIEGATAENGFEVTPDMLTLLGPQFILPEAGRISPGIKILKNGCSEADKKLYDQMVVEGYGWDDIEKKLGADSNGKSKLRPQNVDFLTIHPQTCKNPRHCQTIMSRYADENDGKLRSLPVLFTSNNWWEIMPHGLICFSKGEVRYRSAFKLIKDEFGRTNAVRICEAPREIEKGKRMYGGRGYIENRVCDPDNCPEYQSVECKFCGYLQFLIPGIPGIGVWKLRTNSWYSLVAIKSALELVSGFTKGRLAGLSHNGKPVFRLSKVEGAVSRIDTEKCKAVKTDQWLIHLDADVDITELVMQNSNNALIDRGRRALSILGNGYDERPSFVHQVEIPAAASAVFKDGGTDASLQSSAAAEDQTAATGADAPLKTDSPPRSVDSGEPALKEQISAIKKMAVRLGVDDAAVEQVVQGINIETAKSYIARLNKGDKDMFYEKPF